MHGTKFNNKFLALFQNPIMKADLHCHSFFSDGKHSPEFLLQRAKELSITHIAITDHDCITMLNKSLVDHYCVKVIPGVEISCNWESKEIHVVGLGIDHQNEALQSLLARQRAARRERIAAISRLLETQEIKGLPQYVKSLPCVSITRSHVADFLVSSGISKNRPQAFSKYLGKQGRAFISSDWSSLSLTNEAISNAGGIPVLAHPGRYSLNKRQLNELIGAFKDRGGQAIEVSYGGINPLVQKNLEEIALSKDLFVSAGSDFHDAKAHWTDLGKFPAITVRAEKNAVWKHSRWHP